MLKCASSKWHEKGLRDGPFFSFEGGGGAGQFFWTRYCVSPSRYARLFLATCLIFLLMALHARFFFQPFILCRNFFWKLSNPPPSKKKRTVPYVYCSLFFLIRCWNDTCDVSKWFYFGWPVTPIIGCLGNNQQQVVVLLNHKNRQDETVASMRLYPLPFPSRR